MSKEVFKETAMNEAHAKRDHDQLIEMGGRPTRPVRLQPISTAIHRGGLYYIIGSDGELERTLSDDIHPMEHHWLRESKQFREELERWQKFKKCQRNFQHERRLETQLELDHTDARLINVLTRLSDWEEFRVFQRQFLVEALEFEDRRRLEFLDFIEWDVTAQTNSAAHEVLRTWLHLLDTSEEEVEAANSQLNWVKNQWPKVVAESVEAMSETPELQLKLEAKFRKQTNAAFSAIQELGGRPSHTVSQPSETMDDLHRILYWSSETSKYTEELLDWKTFLNWRRHSLGDKTSMKGRKYQCPQFESASDFFAEFRKFRRYQQNIALAWLKLWQRMVRWHEEEIETPDPEVPDITPGYLEDYAEIARSHMRDSEQKLAHAATQLEKATQEHAHTFSEHGHLTGGESRIELPQNLFPPTPPASGSGSSESSHSSSSPPESFESSCTPPSSHPSLSSRSSSSPPQSSHSSLSPRSASSPPQSSQTPQPSEPLFKDRRPSIKRGSIEKIRRRSKKDNARKGGSKIEIIDTKQEALPKFSLGPHEVEKDDVQMTDASEDPRSFDTTEDFETAETEDSVMTKLEDTPNQNSSSSKNQVPASRKTRSATKLDQSSSGRVPKKKGKKPAKKVKTFTEQQTIMLLNAASINGSPTDSPPLRRSERLKEKVAASNNTPSTQIFATQNPQPSGPKRPQQNPSLVENSQSPRQKKRKIEPEIETDSLGQSQPPRQKKRKLEPEIDNNPLGQSQSPRQKKRELELEIDNNPLGQSQSPRQKKRKIEPEAELDPLEPSQTLIQKRPKIKSHVHESSRSQRQKKLEKRARDAARLG